MKAIKGNRVYTITEAEKDSYQKQGFDIKDDNGHVVAFGAGKVIAFEKYAELLKKYEVLAEENEKLRKEASKKNKSEVKSKSKKGAKVEEAKEEVVEE